MTSPKDLVKTNDYCAFCIEMTEVWKNLENQVQKNRDETLEQSKGAFKVMKRFINLQPSSEITEKQDIQLDVITPRLDMLLTEYYRTQYYSMYNFESIEIHPSLRDAFFSWSHDKLRSQMNIH